jgi:hypothetical protein
MKRILRLVALSAMTAVVLVTFSSCRIVPSVSMGVGVDYYGGGFHARPYGNVGFRGYP